ncbi:low molecular weight phosphotyrosine protein phosphatase [Azoarcus sp. L1K30]|uniref:low molecular weight protein-tyrosine-phosphatase n=1 Tax=Azoarcus sp. L1K30 TaxID=2820277 RepID=UPI001B821E02|nr:low molecular weight protein-tyrosine-phosphatase [Azoarcus sp. L1K30]MBR0565730.1 low molecular weight phosphotyrosine protein phosphatase [Azoarcus sp. L1K30]
MKRILFVCSGNICRSPTAEGVARNFIEAAGLGDEIEVDSAGTQGYHAGEGPDPRSARAAAQRGYDLTTLRARKIELRDYQEFDLLLAMDRRHLEFMMRDCPEVYRHKIGLFMQFAPSAEHDEVPDPFYGGLKGFEYVLDQCEEGVKALLAALAATADHDN